MEDPVWCLTRHADSLCARASRQIMSFVTARGSLADAQVRLEGWTKDEVVFQCFVSAII